MHSRFRKKGNLHVTTNPVEDNTPWKIPAAHAAAETPRPGQNQKQGAEIGTKNPSRRAAQAAVDRPAGPARPSIYEASLIQPKKWTADRAAQRLRRGQAPSQSDGKASAAATPDTKRQPSPFLTIVDWKVDDA